MKGNSTSRRFPQRNAGHLVDDEGGAVDVIRLPALRNVRADEYRPFWQWVNEGREWAEESLEFVERARVEPGFRHLLVSEMRNAMWFIRNHRSVGVDSVERSVMFYCADEHLLRLAGVSVFVLAALSEFFSGSCKCKGDCGSVSFDPMFPETSGGLCDHLARALQAAVLSC